MYFNTGFCAHNCHPSSCMHCNPGYSSSTGFQQSYNNNGMFGQQCNRPIVISTPDPYHHDHHHGHHGHHGGYGHHHKGW